MKRLILFSLCAVNVLLALSRSVSINDGWLFRQTPADEWKPVNLPHSWNSDAYRDKEYRKGKSFYRRSISLSPADSLRRFYLRLEGASKSSEVSVNGKPAGHHEGG